MSYPSHLTHEEIERYAFLAGDDLIASLAETVHGLEQENLTLTSNEESIRINAFEAGRIDGLGEDVQAAITSLNARVSSLQQQLTKATELLGACHAWLQGDQTKTIKGRREAAHALSNRMTSQGLGYPRH